MFYSLFDAARAKLRTCGRSMFDIKLSNSTPGEPCCLAKARVIRSQLHDGQQSVENDIGSFSRRHWRMNLRLVVAGTRPRPTETLRRGGKPEGIESSHWSMRKGGLCWEIEDRFCVVPATNGL